MMPTPLISNSLVTRLYAGLRDELRERREARTQNRVLMRELAEYRTPSAIADLRAAADRLDTPQAEQIRTILSHNLATYHRTHMRG
jgi:hypothetical protein